MKAIQLLINRCLKEGEVLHMVGLLNQARAADKELKEIREWLNVAATVLEEEGYRKTAEGVNKILELQ